LHELRRTFATRLRDAGILLEDVQRLGRWASYGMLLELYSASDDERLRAPLTSRPCFGLFAVRWAYLCAYLPGAEPGALMFTQLEEVPRAGIEPATPGSSDPCSAN